MAEPRSETEVIETYKQMRQEVRVLSERISELESKVGQHQLIRHSGPLPHVRTCTPQLQAGSYGGMHATATNIKQVLLHGWRRC